MSEKNIPSEILREFERMQKSENERNAETDTDEYLKELVESLKEAHQEKIEKVVLQQRNEAREAVENIRDGERTIERFKKIIEAQKISGYEALTKAELNQLINFLKGYILEIDPLYKQQYQQLFDDLTAITTATKSELERE